MRAARRFRATGGVQGVGYRAFAAAEARALGLAGWVRNEPDGSVTVEAEGAPAALDALRARLLADPPGARVAELETEAAAPAGAAAFEIRR